MQKQVLILCDTFPPAFAPRMGYLCKYLKQYAWKPTVITEDNIRENIFAFLKSDADVRYIRYRKLKDGFLSKIEWFAVLLADWLLDYHNRRMYYEALKASRKQSFDVVLCSSHRVFPLPAARRIARKLHLPLVIDLRDIIEQCADNEYISSKVPRLGGLEKPLVEVYRRILLRQRNRVLRDAAWITTVSPWHVGILKAFNARVELIYNGYDPEIFYPAPIRSKQFYITYTGRMFNTALRDPSFLFQAIARLDEEGIISPETFRIRWFMDEKSKRIILDASRSYPLAAYMDFGGYVAASEIPAILNESAILLILSNKSGETGPNGIMTTKFFEYVAVERPVLCVRGDEGCLEEVINTTRAGLSAHSPEDVYNFIRSQYQQWKKTGYTTVDVNREEIAKFSRRTQAGQFVCIFDRLTEA